MKKRLIAILLCAGCTTPAELEFAHDLLDLGAALPGTATRKQVQLINKSTSPLHFAGTASTNPAFSLVLPLQSVLPPSETATLTVHHVPPTGATEPQAASLLVWTDEGAEATLEVHSVPTTPDCALPATIDFGGVKVGESVTLELPLSNDTVLDDAAELEPMAVSAFAVEHGRYAISAGGEVKLPITFHAARVAEFESTLTLRRHQLCRPRAVPLFGTGVTTVLSVEPSSLTWLTPAGVTHSQLVSLKNRGVVPITLSDVRTREGTDLSQVFRATRIPLRVPAAERAANGALIPGEATIEVSFTPSHLGSWMGQLTMNTDHPAFPLLSVELSGVSP